VGERAVGIERRQIGRRGAGLGPIRVPPMPFIAKTTLVSGPTNVAIDEAMSGSTDDLRVTMTRS
jgi:hypothetical protein